MDDIQSTTDATPIAAGATAEPEQQVEQTAASQPAEPTQTPDQGEPSVDDNLAWLQKKGIDPQSPEALSKIAEMYRNAETKMHESTAKASQLEKSLTTDQPQAVSAEADDIAGLRQTVAELKMAQNVNTFWATNPEAKAMESQMAEIVTARPAIGELVKAGYLGLDDLYNLARGTEGSEATLKAAGGKEALEKVAQKTQAKAIVGAATNSDLSPAKDDPFLTGLKSAS